MSDTPPEIAKSVQTEKVNFNLDALSEEEVESLRSQLKKIAKGLTGAQSDFSRAGEFVEAHSSHRDTDGWI